MIIVISLNAKRARKLLNMHADCGFTKKFTRYKIRLIATYVRKLFK